MTKAKLFKLLCAADNERQQAYRNKNKNHFVTSDSKDKFICF